MRFNIMFSLDVFFFIRHCRIAGRIVRFNFYKAGENDILHDPDVLNKQFIPLLTENKVSEYFRQFYLSIKKVQNMIL